MGDISAPQISNQRLDSWKEIAAFFGRDERTVRRWEKERGLPAHRVPGGGRGGVFAYTDELKEWLKGKDKELETSEPESLGLVSGDEGIEAMPGEALANEVALGQTLDIQLAPAPPRPFLIRIAAWLALLLIFGSVGVFWLRHRETRYQNAVVSRHLPNPEAQELYLKGEYHWAKRTPEDLNKAVDYFIQSIVKDPSYAQAYVGLADCYNLLREFSVMPAEEAYPRALAAAQKAVELDDASAGAHNSLAFVTFYWNWDPVTAEREFNRALQLDPNFVRGHHWYATFLFVLGRFPEALDQIEQARKLDPSSTTIQADKGWILYVAGRKSDAFTLLKQLESTDPSLATTHTYLASIYRERKDYADFFAESGQSAQLRRDAAGLAVANAAERGFAAGGSGGMWKRMLPVQKQFFDQGSISAYDLAVTCASLEKKEEALKYLQAAYEKRETMVLAMNRDPALNVLHDDSAYKEIAERIAEQLSGNHKP